MRYKFKVGQVVRWDDDVWEIGSHHREDGKNWYMLKLKYDKYFEMAKENDLKKLTKKQIGDK